MTFFSAARTTPSFARTPRTVPACEIASMAYSTNEVDQLRIFDREIVGRRIYFGINALKAIRQLSTVEYKKDSYLRARK